jgi:hypothetical protein
MSRCPNCYNTITQDSPNCPSCAYLLVQSEKTPMSHLSGLAAAPSQSRHSGRLRASDPVRGSGRLDATDRVGTSGRLIPLDQAPGSADERPRTGRGPNGTGRRSPEATGQKPRKGVREAPDEESRRRKKILIPLVVIAIGAAVVLLAPATQLIAPQVDATTSISTLTAFRSQQSKQPGKTVDQCMNEMLDESRKSGQFVRYSGWSIKPVSFNKSKIVLGFSFEEKDGLKVAEWSVDVDTNTFIPKNDLAAQVYGKAD